MYIEQNNTVRRELAEWKILKIIIDRMMKKGEEMKFGFRLPGNYEMKSSL